MVVRAGYTRLCFNDANRCVFVFFIAWLFPAKGRVGILRLGPKTIDSLHLLLLFDQN
jgi:hypothetical protein